MDLRTLTKLALTRGSLPPPECARVYSGGHQPYATAQRRSRHSARLVARLLRSDGGNIRSGQQKRECFGLWVAIDFGLFL